MRWYQKSGWIVFFLIIFAPVGIVFTWKYSTWKKTTKAVTSAVFGLLFVFGLIHNVQSIGSTQALSENTSSSLVGAASQTAGFSGAALTPDNVKNAISNSTVKSKLTDVKISGGTVTVVVYDKDGWSTKSYLGLNQANSAAVFHDLFVNKKVSAVVYQADVSVTDAYGKSSRVTAQTNTMKRADADKVADWENFAYESPAQFYSVVNFELAPESKVSGLHAAWVQYYKG